MSPQFAASAALKGSPSSAKPLARAVPTKSRQMKGAAEIRHQAELGRKQLQKRRGARRHHDVAHQREADPGTRSDAVDRDHHRYTQLKPGVHHRVEIFAQAGSDVRAAAALRVAEQIVAHEIGAGTKCAADGGEHHGTNVPLGVDRRGGRCQIGDERPIQRVQPVRAVERDVGDAVPALE